MLNIKRRVCEGFKKPLAEVSVEYTPEEEIPAIGIPAQYFINALNDVDKWEESVEVDECGYVVRKLTNKETGDEASMYSTSFGYSYNYPGKGWMNCSERKAVEEAVSNTYKSIMNRKQKAFDEASRQKMFKDYGEYR